jgi:alanyl-tRNA synthetase
MKLADAKRSGAHHQFDEKYEDDVRVVTLYNSVELCGGTHVKNVGDIKKFAIMGVESKGANIYRIEAATDVAIEKELFKVIKPYNDEMIKLLNKAKGILDDAKKLEIELDFNVEIDNEAPQSYKDVIFDKNEVMMVREKVKNLEKEYNSKKQEKLLKSNNEFNTIEIINDLEIVVKKVEDYDMPILKTLIDNVFNKISKGLVFVANVKGSNVNFICKSNCDINAGALIKDASIKSNGNGGGSNAFGQGGGTTTEYVDEILESVKTKIGEL